MTFFLSQTCRYHLTVADADSTGSEQVAHATGDLTGLPDGDILLLPTSSTTGQNLVFEAEGLGSRSGDGAEILPVAGLIPVGSREVLSVAPPAVLHIISSNGAVPSVNDDAVRLTVRTGNEEAVPVSLGHQTFPGNNNQSV